MNAKKCDSCKEYYDTNKISCKATEGNSTTYFPYSLNIKCRGGIDGKIFSFDLCDNCMEKLLDSLGIESKILKKGEK